MSRDHTPPRLCEVAVDAPIKNSLTYLVPPALAAEAELGKRVLAPLSGRKVTGYLVGFPGKSETSARLKEIIEILDDSPLFDEQLLALYRWASSYYFCPLAEVIKSALPAGINVASKKVAAITEAGIAALGQGAAAPPLAGLGEDDLCLLAAIGRLGEIKVKAPPAEAAGLVQESRLARLGEMGLIDFDQRVGGPRVKARTERAVRLASPPDEQAAKKIQRAPEQARLLALLEQKGQAAMPELRREFKDPARLVRALCSAGLAETFEIEAERSPFAMDLAMGDPPRSLTAEQELAVGAIGQSLADGGFSVFMLQGVTGSGKTEVYIQAMKRALELGGGALMLVPEIGLTPQLIGRLRQRFPASQMAALHSGLSAGERHDQWRRISRGEARIALGARSAVFAPVRDLRLIIVDEEQEGAYKQDHGFMYQARDLAVMRAKLGGIAAVLGSATPSIESASRARQEGGYRLLTLTSRALDRPLPEVEIVDLRELAMQAADLHGDGPAEPPGADGRVKDRDRISGAQLISEPLRAAVDGTLERGEQSILFLNRRGVSAFVLCRDCGSVLSCPNCDVSLSHHQKGMAGQAERCRAEPAAGGFLLCHYCGHQSATPEVCPECRGVRLTRFGVGSEQLEQAVVDLWPGARVMRMDSDSVGGKEGYFRMLDRASRGLVDIIVGTQMVAKGHDLPGVTLVGALLADLGLTMPDFRAAERTFQILTQVAGRAGRGDRPGRVIIQTMQPDHYSITLAMAQDFEAFYEKELGSRRLFWYPPFARLCNFRITAAKPERAERAARTLGRVAKQVAGLKDFRGRLRILGPAKAPIARIKGKSRWMLLVKADSPATLSRACAEIMARYEKAGPAPGVKIEPDRDPGMIM